MPHFSKWTVPTQKECRFTSVLPACRLALGARDLNFEMGVRAETGTFEYFNIILSIYLYTQKNEYFNIILSIYVIFCRHALGMPIDMAIEKRAFPRHALGMPMKCIRRISSARRRNRHFEPWLQVPR